MGKIEINLTLRFKVPEGELNVNGVVRSLKDNTSRISFAILECLFRAIEEKIIYEMKKSEPSRYVKNGYQHKARQIRTCFGIFRYRLTQVYDKIKGKNLVLLRNNGFLQKYKQCTKESGEAGIGLAVHLSYRKSVKEIQRITGNSPSVSTLHRSLQEFSQDKCRWPDMKDKKFRFLMVDGTRVILQDGKGRTIKPTEIRLAMASAGEREPFKPVGLWVDKDWRAIKQDLKERLNYNLIEVLFSDGELAIELLLEEGMRHQRCLIHGKKDFGYLLWRDGLRMKEKIHLMQKLENIPIFGLTKKGLENIKGKDVSKVKELADKTVKGFVDMIKVLDPDVYPKSRTYIENLSKSISTFFSWWLDHKAWIPLNTNAIESAFSLVKNRIKRIGRRWSEKGLTNWLMVTMNKIFFPHMWKELWDQYMELNPGFELLFVRSSYRWR